MESETLIITKHPFAFLRNRPTRKIPGEVYSVTTHRDAYSLLPFAIGATMPIPVLLAGSCSVALGRTMPQNYVPVFLFVAVVGALIPITLVLAKLVRPNNPNRAKLSPYECGIDPVDRARGRYTVRYYIIAILFVVFDVETIFLFPWAVKFKALGVFGLVEMLVFLGILVVGYIWIWQKGALEWV